MISLPEQKQPVLFLLFIVAAVGLRFFSFFPSVLDHDESTYMIIGRDILNGKSLYTDVTDTKPVGIFLFYAGLEFLTGNSIFWKRFVFAIVVGLTAFLVFKVSKKLFENRKVAFASGIIYIFYTSVWNYHGRSPNTELLFNLFTETIKAFNVDADDELKRIMEADPEFVVIQRNNAEMKKLMGVEYELIKTFDNKKVSVYRRI